MSTEVLRMRLPKFRVSYASVFEPKLNKLSGKMEYSLDALFDKEENDLKELVGLINKAVEEMWPDKKTRPKKIKTDIIKDGDEKENDPTYNGCWYVKLKSQTKPTVVGTKRQADGSFVVLESEDDFYSGCYARAMVTVKAYDHEGVSRGVAIYLGNIQKLADGEPLGGGNRDPKEDFGDDTPEDTDSDSDEFGF